MGNLIMGEAMGHLDLDRKDFTARSGGVSGNMHQVCVIITEVEEENSDAGNLVVDTQGNKLRSNSGKEKEKIYVSTGEWRIIMSAINHGTDVPTNLRREVLMGYQYDRDDGRRRDGLSRADPEPLPLPPPVNDHREENQGGYQEPQGFAACLLGGAQAPLSNRHFKQLSWEIAVAQPNVNSHRLKWSTSKIGFDEEDHPISTKVVGTIPLMCTPTINNIAINRTLIDGVAGLNIISVEVFEKMQVPYHQLMPTRPFFGVTEGSTTPIGHACHFWHQGQLQDRKP
jgi:hypothetical protein